MLDRLQSIEQARLERAITGSLRVARSSGADLAEVDVGEPLRRAIATLRREYGSRAMIDDSGVGRNAVLIRGDPSSLEQLFVNVITNGIQAISQTGNVSVSIDRTTASEVGVIVHDDGVGMPPDVLARAGEPTFSTKAEGTGLGLAIAKRIAVAHRATVTIESAAGSGTTVRVILPIS